MGRSSTLLLSCHFLSSRWRCAILAGSLCAVSANPGFAADADSIISNRGAGNNTLTAIYELAIENDFTIAQARAQLRADSEVRKINRAGLLPNLTGNFTDSNADTDSLGQFAAGGAIFDNVTETDQFTETLSVSLSQPIFNMAAWFRFKQGVVLSEQGETRFALAQQDLLVRTINAYVAVLRAAYNLNASQVQEEAFEIQLEQLNQRLEVGLVAITDVLEAQAAYDLAVAQRINDTGLLDVSREQLTVLTGIEHSQPLWEIRPDFPVVDPEPASSTEWVNFALANNLDIEFAKYAQEAARRGKQIAYSNHLPTLNFSYNFNDRESVSAQDNLRLGTSTRFPNDSESSTISFNLSVPLFTGGQLSASRRQAVANLDAQTYGYEGTVRGVTQQTRSLYAQMVSDAARSYARERAVTSAEAALEAAEAGFELGSRNIVDVVNAQQVYFSAIRDRDNSVLDYILSMIQLKRLAGTLSPADIYDLNQWLEQPQPAPAQ
ncbi:MAG: TolC family outer membrane protein [Pseudomonadales bacterium]|nr:TolC family outer membrane protein [Pseudomonadales bacterium]